MYGQRSLEESGSFHMVGGYNVKIILLFFLTVTSLLSQTQVIPSGSASATSLGTVVSVDGSTATTTCTIPTGTLIATCYVSSLSTSVTANTLTGTADGQQITWKICRDATATRGWTWPSNVIGFLDPIQIASGCTVQSGTVQSGNLVATTGAVFIDSGSTGVADFILLKKGSAIPTAAIPSGYIAQYANNSDAAVIKTTAGTETVLGSGGATAFSMDLNAGACYSVGGQLSHWNHVPGSTPALGQSCSGADTDQFSISFANTDSPTITKQFILPDNWVSGSATNFKFWVYNFVGTGNIKFKASIGCRASGDSGASFTYNATADTGTVAAAAAGVWQEFTISSIPTSGSSTCAIGKMAVLKLERDNTVGSTMAGGALFYGGRLYQ